MTYNPNVLNPSCQGKRGENPCYDGDQLKIMKLYGSRYGFRAERLISVDARIKNGEKVDDMNLTTQQRRLWEECSLRIRLKRRK